MEQQSRGRENGKGKGEGEIWGGVVGDGRRRAHLTRRGRSAVGALALTARARARMPLHLILVVAFLSAFTARSRSQARRDNSVNLGSRAAVSAWHLVSRCAFVSRTTNRNKPLLTDAKDAPLQW